MIDTLRVDIEAHDWKGVPASGWRSVEAKGAKLLLDGSREEFTSLLYQHEESGLRIGGSVQNPRWVEVSLPKLIHGSNGILLKESECERSTSLLRDLVEQCVVAPNYCVGASRIDLVGQFDGKLQEWNSALRRVPHEKVRRPGLEFFNSGLVWPGKYMHARLYDKGLEQTGKPSNVVRLEFQTRSGVIPKNVVGPGARINYSAAYRAYSRFCRGFVPRRVPKITKIAELLAWCELCSFEYNGLTPTESYLAGLKPRQQRNIRQALSKIRLAYFNIDWDELVPASGSPRFVDYEAA